MCKTQNSYGINEFTKYYGKPFSYNLQTLYPPVNILANLLNLGLCGNGNIFCHNSTTNYHDYSDNSGIKSLYSKVE